MSYAVWFGGDSSHDDGFAPAPVVRDRFERVAAALPAGDAMLVARVRAGDVPAFETAFRDLYPPLVRFARTCGLAEDDADDAVVDIFAAVWEARATWSPARSVAAYFFRAIRNRALNLARDAGVAARYTAAAAHDNPAPLMGVPPDPPDRALERSERTAGLWDAVATLPERQRVLLTLRWRDDLSIDEIAAVLGIATGATKTALTRATRALRSVLPDDFV